MQLLRVSTANLLFNTVFHEYGLPDKAGTRLVGGEDVSVPQPGSMDGWSTGFGDLEEREEEPRVSR